MTEWDLQLPDVHPRNAGAPVSAKLQHDIAASRKRLQQDLQELREWYARFDDPAAVSGR